MIKRYNVAVSMDFSDANFGGVFTNGLRQNTIFVYRMFKASPNCANAWLMNCGSVDYQFPEGTLGIPPDGIVKFDQVKDDIDYLVVVGHRPNVNILKYLRDRGCKIVFYKGGNSAVLSMEGMTDAHPDKYGEQYFDREFYDTIWLTPQHMHTYAGWAKTMYRMPVTEVPQVWDPSFLELQTSETQSEFGYRKRKKGQKWKVGITDPNITVMKTIHMPVLVCEAAYRQRPEAFQKIFVTNSLQFMQVPHFTSFLESLSATRDGIITVEQRFMLYDFLAKHADAIVTHHWENGLNYLYYEVLYGGYPLIHNSGFLKDFGYYYKDFDAFDGARALLEAFKSHDRNLAAYKKQNQILFDRLNPQAPATIELHEKLMFAI